MSHTIVGRAPRNPIWVFEENYRLFNQLLTFLPEEGESVSLSSPRDESDLEIEVVEIARYTVTLSLRKSFAVDQQLLPSLQMRVRLYDDARVAEVIAYQGCDRIPARYAVADRSHYHRDEKRQINYLLHDLLRHCRGYGFALHSDSDLTPI